MRRFNGTSFVSAPDAVAGEEPLEIRVDGRSWTTTMRTPGHDLELVHGLLHAEGVIATREDVRTVRYCNGVDEEGRNTYNVMDVQLTDPQAARADVDRAERNLLTTSACGVCGTASIEALQRRSRHQPAAGPVFDPTVLTALPGLLRASQPGFRRTGGLHAAALAGPDGGLRFVREDVGRHNAVDKVIGAALLEGRLPIDDAALLVSSRASFELVQKASLVGIGLLVAVSAPSSLAVELARAVDLTLVAFTRESGFNLYSGHHRVAGA